MALPNTKQEFANWILRRLGAPVVNVEVTNEQLEDCIDEAVQRFQEWHYDGTLRSYRTIKITDEMLEGNNRIHQNITAPMFDVNKLDSYRVGDRVMTYTPTNGADRIWVRFDSDERLVKSFFSIDAAGGWATFSSNPALEIVADSDGAFVLYDSETHTTTVYFVDPTKNSIYVPVATPANPKLGYYYAESDGSYVLYDSDKHTFLAYQVNAAGAFVDSDGVKVAYDVTKHFTPTYQAALLGAYVDSEGSYVLYDSDKHTITGTNRDANQNQDSDETLYALWNGAWYVYDSDVWKDIRYPRQPVLYTRGAISPVRYNLVNVPSTRYSTYTNTVQLFQQYDENLWVDSDSSYVAYDSDKHFAYKYDSDLTGSWVDSEGAKVAYDSDKHNRFVYVVDAAGYWVDSEQDGVAVAFDSDKHTYIVYETNTAGAFVDSDSNWVLYDSDKHNTNTYQAQTYDITSVAANSAYFVGTNGYTSLLSGGDVVFNYANYTQNLAAYISADSDIQLNVGGIPFKVATKDFWLKGSTDTSGFDSDGYGNALSFGALDGLRVRFQVGLGSVRITSYIIDPSIGNTTQDPLAGGTIRMSIQPLAGINSGADFYNISLNGTYNRSWTTPTPTALFKKVSVPFVRYTTSEAQPIRYRRYSVPLQRFSRQNTFPVLFNRRDQLLVTRYNRANVEIYSTNKTFEQMWKAEEAVLNEPYLDLDYSKQGQVGIIVPNNIISVTKVFRINSAIAAGMWSYEYQYFLTNFDWFYGSGGGGSQPMTNYYTTRTYLEMIDHMLNTTPAIRFNKYENRLYIDTSWAKINQARGSQQYLLVEVYERADPETWGRVYNDSWLKKYATALVKRQWGSNLKKYSGAELPGGLTVNGQDIYNEAVEEIDKLDEELKGLQLEMDSILIG